MIGRMDEPAPGVFAALKIPRFIPHTKPTPPDQTDTTGRMAQSLSDQSDVARPVRPLARTSQSLGRGFDPHRPY